MAIKERWEIDASHSQLGFSLRHIVISQIQGRFRRWGGEMIVDPDHIHRSQVRVWVDLASVDTGSADRDAHLRSAEFFDTARFPLAAFASTDVALRADGEAALTGSLQLHGASGGVELNVIAERSWVDADDLLRAVYRVRGAVDRQAFGLHWNQDLDIGGVVVGDRVEIDARVEMVRSGRADHARVDSAGVNDAAPGAP